MIWHFPCTCESCAKPWKSLLNTSCEERKRERREGGRGERREEGNRGRGKQRKGIGVRERKEMEEEARRRENRTGQRRKLIEVSKLLVSNIPSHRTSWSRGGRFLLVCRTSSRPTTWERRELQSQTKIEEEWKPYLQLTKLPEPSFHSFSISTMCDCWSGFLQCSQQYHFINHSNYASLQNYFF